MKTLYLEKSTGEGRGGDWVEQLDLAGVGRIVVGTGPGSFAGIRSAIAFAQGYALGCACEVLGLPSPCAVAAQVHAAQGPLAVVGDARRGMSWIALFDGLDLVRPVFQVETAALAQTVPLDAQVVTPDDARIGALLAEVFGERYRGGVRPTADGLKAYAEARPGALVPEPRPIYLNPAVRESHSG